MDRKEIIRQVMGITLNPDLERLSTSELGGLMIHVLETDHDALSERSVNALLVAAACLMREHCDAVEKDILSVREIFNRR